MPGIYAALVGSMFVIALTAAIAVPLGVGRGNPPRGVRRAWPAVAAHRDQHREPGRRAVDHLRPARAGTVRAGHGHGTERAGWCVDAGAARAAGRDPLDAGGAAGRAKSLREGSYALGATKWQTIWHQVLPAAFPGILTGLILSLSRAIGETAPLITIGALTYVPFAPDSIWSPFTVLPIQVFDWVSRPQASFAENAAAGIIVLLGLLLVMNATAIVLRDGSSDTRLSARHAGVKQADRLRVNPQLTPASRPRNLAKIRSSAEVRFSGAYRWNRALMPRWMCGSGRHGRQRR